MLQLPVYLDYNATTPCDPRVLEAMIPYFTRRFGNAASRNHLYGWEAEEAVELARGQVAALINAEAKEIVFTSGATEADNLALKGIYETYQAKGKHIITCVTEHNAVLDTCKQLGKIGAEVTCLDVKADGMIDIQQLESALRPATILIAIMYANNETGVIQPIKEIGRIAKKHGILFFCDATQAIGKIPVNVKEDGIDLMAFSAHKIYGPKGTGALFVRRRDPRVRLTAQINGGGHEKGMRSGTLNVPGIVGLGKACEISGNEMEAEAERLSHLRNKLENALTGLEQVAVNGNKQQRMPHITNLSFKYVEGQALMMGLNKNIAVSSGSACTSASLEPSHVLMAMGLDEEEAHSSIRFALGRYTTGEEIDYAIGKVTEAVNELRKVSPLWEMYKESIIMNAVVDYKTVNRKL